MKRTRSRSIPVLGGALLAAICIAEERPYQELPYTPSLDVSAMDRTADPCEDLYPYSCGGWKKNNPIPADQAAGASTGSSTRTISATSGASSRTRPSRSAAHADAAEDRRLLRRLHGRGGIEAPGIAPLQPDLERIDALCRPGRLLAPLLGELHCAPPDAGHVLRQRCRAGRTDAIKVIAAVYAGGLGLARPRLLLQGRREVRGDPRTRYVEHVAKMFELLGDSPSRQRERGQRRDAHRDRAREGLAHPGRAPRSLQDLSPQDARRAAQAGASVRLGTRTSRPLGLDAGPVAQRLRAGVLPAS